MSYQKQTTPKVGRKSNRITEAVVVRGVSDDFINDELKECINDGFEPQGGVTCTASTDQDGPFIEYAVLMVRRS